MKRNIRKEAMTAGATTYTDDAPCATNPAHGARRYTKNGICVACAIGRARKQTEVRFKATAARQALNRIKQGDRNRLALAQSCACAHCGSMDHALHVDWITPIALGGAPSLSNRQLLCAPCAKRKRESGMTDADYRAHHGIAACTPWDGL